MSEEKEDKMVAWFNRLSTGDRARLRRLNLDTLSEPLFWQVYKAPDNAGVNHARKTAFIFKTFALGDRLCHATFGDVLKVVDYPEHRLFALLESQDERLYREFGMAVRFIVQKGSPIPADARWLILNQNSDRARIASDYYRKGADSE